MLLSFLIWSKNDDGLFMLSKWLILQFLFSIVNPSKIRSHCLTWIPTTFEYLMLFYYDHFTTIFVLPFISNTASRLHLKTSNAHECFTLEVIEI